MSNCLSRRVLVALNAEQRDLSDLSHERTNGE